jgi:uncharacterized damage-inducible protein DinB
MCKDYFIRFWQYNHWANETYFALFTDLQSQQIAIPERIEVLVSHVVQAQKLWLTRLEGKPDLSIDIWQKQPLAYLRQMSAENTNNWIAYLERIEPSQMDSPIAYRNFQNKPYLNSPFEICMQNITHAGYHRAQYALLLRQADIAPPNTDFITYCRVMTSQEI